MSSYKSTHHPPALQMHNNDKTENNEAMAFERQMQTMKRSDPAINTQNDMTRMQRKGLLICWISYELQSFCQRCLVPDTTEERLFKPWLYWMRL